MGGSVNNRANLSTLVNRTCVAVAVVQSCLFVINEITEYLNYNILTKSLKFSQRWDMACLAYTVRVRKFEFFVAIFTQRICMKSNLHKSFKRYGSVMDGFRYLVDFSRGLSFHGEGLLPTRLPPLVVQIYLIEQLDRLF